MLFNFNLGRRDKIEKEENVITRKYMGRSIENNQNSSGTEVPAPSKVFYLCI